MSTLDEIKSKRREVLELQHQYELLKLSGKVNFRLRRIEDTLHGLKRELLDMVMRCAELDE